MITQLCGNFFQDWGLLIILVVFLVFMLVFSASKRKKDAQMAEDFANNLKVGDKIKTYSGIYGKIISIKDTPSGKVATIETGEGKNVSYMTVDVFAIYNIESPVKEKTNESKLENNETIKDEPINNLESNEVKTENVDKQDKKTTKKKKENVEENIDIDNVANQDDNKTKKTTRNKTTKKEQSEFEKLKNEENK